RRGFRAQNDQILRRGERSLDLLAQVARGSKLLLVAKDRCQPLGDDSVGGKLAGERPGHPEPLDLAMQPVGEFLVLMAVAEESIIAGVRPRDAARFRMPI